MDRRYNVNTGTSAAPIANTLIHAHTTSRTLLTCDISLGSLTVATPEAGDFVELVEQCSKLSGIHDAISYGGRFGKLETF